MSQTNYLEHSVEQMSDADERRRNAAAQWQANIYSPGDILALRLPTVEDVNIELRRHLPAYTYMCRNYSLFPSTGLTVLAVLETADNLPEHLRLTYVQEIINRLVGWVADETDTDPAPFDETAGFAAAVEYPQRAEVLHIQGGA
jgi:hypothetical protein